MMVSSSLDSYDVFEHNAKGYEAVKRGFSWPGFFFTVFWAFAKRLWLPGLATCAGITLMTCTPSLEQVEHELLGNSGLGLLLSLLFGCQGNEWRRNQLISTGWKHVAAIQAENPALAVAVFKRSLQPETSAPV